MGQVGLSTSASTATSRSAGRVPRLYKTGLMAHSRGMHIYHMFKPTPVHEDRHDEGAGLTGFVGRLPWSTMNEMRVSFLMRRIVNSPLLLSLANWMFLALTLGSSKYVSCLSIHVSKRRGGVGSGGSRPVRFDSCPWDFLFGQCVERSPRFCGPACFVPVTSADCKLHVGCDTASAACRTGQVLPCSRQPMMVGSSCIWDGVWVWISPRKQVNAFAGGVPARDYLQQACGWTYFGICWTVKAPLSASCCGQPDVFRALDRLV